MSIEPSTLDATDSTAGNAAGPSSALRDTQRGTRGWRLLGLSTLLFAVLQAACPAVIAISAVRVAIGVGALAAAAGTDAAPAGLHQNLIRIPMMLLAFAGASLNLFVIWQVRHLRNRPASQWRMTPVSKKKLRSERTQIALSVLTFVLLAAEWVTHSMLHRPHP